MDNQETSEQRLKQIEILLATAVKTLNRTDERVERKAQVNNDRMDRIERLAEISSDRMDRIERLAEANIVSIDRLTQRMDRTEERMDRADARMAEISEMFIEAVGIIRQHQVNIDKMSSEIRGLQVENQRIILRVLGGDEYLEP